MKRQIFKLSSLQALSVALGAIGHIAPAQAATYYVKPSTVFVSGSGITESTAIQWATARDKAKADPATNDTIVFLPGVYDRTNLGAIGRDDRWLDLTSNTTVKAKNPARTTPDPSQRSIFRAIVKGDGTTTPIYQFAAVGVNNSDMYDNIVVDGFEMENIALNGSYNTVTGVSIQNDCRHITVTNNIFHDMGGGGVGTFNWNSAQNGARLGAAGGADYITVSNNVIYNCLTWTNDGGGGSGISILGASNTGPAGEDPSTTHNFVQNNRIYNNNTQLTGTEADKLTDNNGIILDLFGGFGPDSSQNRYPARTLIENNVVYGNDGRGIHVFKTANVLVRNNTCYQNLVLAKYTNEGELSASFAKDVTFVNNVAYADGTNQPINSLVTNGYRTGNGNVIFHHNATGNGTNVYSTGVTQYSNVTGLTSADFKSDYSLAPLSPAINSGDGTAGSFAPTDTVGTARPQGAGVDKGAYELLPPVAPINLTPVPSSGKVVLTWTASADALSYTVKRGASGSGPFTSLSPKPTITTYTDTAVANGTTYFYVVSASNPGGESPDSAPVNATPLTRAASRNAIISEFRFRGAGGATDEYVEVLNLLAAPLDISGWTLKTNSGPGASPNIQSVLVPANTPPIPRYGHFLFTGAAYSLGSYSASNASLGGDASDDSGALLLDASGATQDAVSFASSNPMFREGTGLISAPSASGQFAWMRDYVVSQAKDTEDSLADWVFVSNTGTAVPGTAGNLTPQLGAPSPESASSPTYYNDLLTTTLLDPGVAAGVAPNRTRIGTGNSGSIIFRRKITNTSGRSVTQLRFSVTRITSLNSPAYTTNQADVRLVSSSDEPVVATSSGDVAVFGTSLEAPSQLTPGGAMGSSVSFTSILSTPLLPGESRNVAFKMQVVTSGNFYIALNLMGIGPPAFMGSQVDLLQPQNGWKRRALPE